MSDAELEFSADELAMLRQAFRGEAQDALEVMTTRILASGAHPPSAESLAEMLRLTHTLKGAAGTVGLPTMVELSHRLETALIALAGRDGPPWSTALGEQLVEVLDGLRVYLDHAPEPSAAAQADAVRAQLARLAPARATTPAVPADAPADAPVDAPDNATVAAAADAPVDGYIRQRGVREIHQSLAQRISGTHGAGGDQFGCRPVASRNRKRTAAKRRIAGL